jgi:hypothetical protein
MHQWKWNTIALIPCALTSIALSDQPSDRLASCFCEAGTGSSVCQKRAAICSSKPDLLLRAARERITGPIRNLVLWVSLEARYSCLSGRCMTLDEANLLCLLSY